MPREVELLTGNHMYSYLSSRHDKYKDLKEMLISTFKNYKSYAELLMVNEFPTIIFNFGS